MTNFPKCILLSDVLKNRMPLHQKENHPLLSNKNLLKSDHSTRRDNFSCRTCFEQKIPVYNRALFNLLSFTTKTKDTRSAVTIDCILSKHCPLLNRQE